MTTINILNDVVVDKVSDMGSDSSVVQAAKVSVIGENERATWGVDDWGAAEKKKVGLINYLMREKHGSPFEHNSMTFFVKAPIFVAREFMRHRVGFSYNEMSGRYTKLAPEFYIPAEDVPLVNSGTSAKPQLTEGDEYQKQFLYFSTVREYQNTWNTYEELIEEGIANEKARIVLPVGIMTQFYVTTNARGLMNFLSLRVHDENAKHISRPQYEIELVARKMEHYFEAQFPTTYEAFQKFGRVAP